MKMNDKYIIKKTMIRRHFIYDNGEDFIMYHKGQVIIVHGDRVNYFKPNRLIDMIIMHEVMERMNLNEQDREAITTCILDIYDEERGKNKNELVLTKEQMEKIKKVIEDV